MGIDVKVYDNGDHTCIVWLPSDLKPIPGCRGFTVQSKCTRTGQTTTNYCHGFVGFDPNAKFDPANPWKFPVQRFLWWDYSVRPGDIVEYTVIPVVGNKDNLMLGSEFASPPTPPMTITGQSTPHLSAFFNKGIIASQWVSRALDNPSYQNKKISDVVRIVNPPDNQLRNALSGLLRPEVLDLMQACKAANGKVYAALYELNDAELIAALKTFGQDCDLILANGAFNPKKPDENAQVRADIKQAVKVFDRMVTGSHFAHNKFVVFCDSDGKPQKVLTGSTNWTFSGLCTQANNGLIVDDPGVAQAYLDAWHRYQAAGNAYPPDLAAANSKTNTYQVDGCSVTPWFVPTQHGEDLDFARKLINGAKEGILFLFFNPGTFQPDNAPQKWTLLQNILYRHHQENNPNYNPNLYIKGVVNQEIANLTNDGEPKKAPVDPSAPPPQPVALYSGGIEPPLMLGHDVMVPANIKAKFADWEKELLGASMVNIHSKVIVLDPFGDHPVVMTGSHNLGFKASSQNDDNLCIIEGNAPLAAAYAVNIIAIFQTYRWNSYTSAHQKDPTAWHGLVDNDQWQAGYMQGDHLAEIKFWLGEIGAKAPAVARPAVAKAAAASVAPPAFSRAPVVKAASASTPSVSPTTSSAVPAATFASPGTRSATSAKVPPPIHPPAHTASVKGTVRGVPSKGKATHVANAGKKGHAAAKASNPAKDARTTPKDGDR